MSKFISINYLISSDPPSIEWHVRFKTVQNGYFIALSKQDIIVLGSEKVLNSDIFILCLIFIVRRSI